MILLLYKITEGQVYFHLIHLDSVQHRYLLSFGLCFLVPVIYFWLLHQVKGLADWLKTSPDKGIHGDEADLLHRKNVYGSNTYPRKKGRSFWVRIAYN